MKHWRLLLIAWFALGAPLTAAALNPCEHGESAAGAHAHHQAPEHSGKPMHHDHQPPASDTTTLDCCKGAGACLGHACMSAPGALMLGTAPVPLPEAGDRERYGAPGADAPAPGYPPPLLRPPA